MTGLKVIDGTLTDVSKYLREEICECGHKKNLHHLIEEKGTWCYDCECIEFKLKVEKK